MKSMNHYRQRTGESPFARDAAGSPPSAVKIQNWKRGSAVAGLPDGTNGRGGWKQLTFEKICGNFGKPFFREAAPPHGIPPGGSNEI
jgi:hypothetical protein